MLSEQLRMIHMFLSVEIYFGQLVMKIEFYQYPGPRRQQWYFFLRIVKCSEVPGESPAECARVSRELDFSPYTPLNHTFAAKAKVEGNCRP